MQFSTILSIAAFVGLSIAAPAHEKRYIAGRCGIHVIQYQKNEHGVGANYRFDIRIVDAGGNTVGLDNGHDIPNFSSAAISSELPYQLIVTTGSVDNDPVQFSYAGYTFSSSTGCSTGKYDGGNREMDCGFGC
ncbi:hypothetical protein F5Y11DRAFT_326528 [Daldinia sp. FL1419]|nr:hypothetical protein F5Y11DRAFT_326528 [Daldinia sp. FL1419]